MRAILIGSRAYKSDYRDTDIICDAEWKAAWDLTYGGLEERRIDGSLTSKYETCEGVYEIIVPSKGSAHDWLVQQSDKWVGLQENWLLGLELKITPTVYLAWMKKAHLILPHTYWEKQMRDYCELKSLMGVDEMPDGYFYKLHRQECLQLAKRAPKLSVAKDTFFDTKESYNLYDHDSIHRAIAYPEPPAYTLTQDGEVWCSSKKFALLSESDKLRTVIEEASILALERSILPALHQDRRFMGVKWAYEYALMKVCTTITSGWFRDYAIEHYVRAKENRFDYIGKFFAAGLRPRKETPPMPE